MIWVCRIAHFDDFRILSLDLGFDLSCGVQYHTKCGLCAID